jgi:23S rRNA pseudoU1915 N3-methylase RlmH
MPRAKTKEAESTSKAEMIRQTAKQLPKPVRPRDIIAALKEKGTKVTSAQVSATLRAMGFRRRRRKSAVLGQESSPNGLNLDALLAAKALIAKVGSVKAAEEALHVLKKLG